MFSLSYASRQLHSEDRRKSPIANVRRPAYSRNIGNVLEQENISKAFLERSQDIPTHILHCSDYLSFDIKFRIQCSSPGQRSPLSWQYFLLPGRYQTTSQSANSSFQPAKLRRVWLPQTKRSMRVLHQILHVYAVSTNLKSPAT